METIQRYITFPEGPYQNRVYLLTNTDHLSTNHNDPTYMVTDNGNTLEAPHGEIVGHYVGVPLTTN